MTQDIIIEWLLQLDRKICTQKRKIILFLDNAGSNPRELKWKNVKVIFLPSNTISLCQPLNQGIIQNFKLHYNDQIFKHILSNAYNNFTTKKIVSLKLYEWKGRWWNLSFILKTISYCQCSMQICPDDYNCGHKSNKAKLMTLSCKLLLKQRIIGVR